MLGHVVVRDAIVVADPSAHACGGGSGGPDAQRDREGEAHGVHERGRHAEYRRDHDLQVGEAGSGFESR